MDVVKQVHIGTTAYVRITAEAKKALPIKDTTVFDTYCTADSIVYKLREPSLLDCVIPKAKFSHYAETVIALLANEKRAYKPTLLKAFKVKHKRSSKTLLKGAISELVACEYLTPKSMQDTYVWRNIDDGNR